MGPCACREWRNIFLLSLRGALALVENEIVGGAFLIAIFFLMILGYPFREKKFWAKNDIVWLVPPIDVSAKKCGIVEVKLLFALGRYASY